MSTACTGNRASARAAYKPPKPPPTTTTLVVSGRWPVVGGEVLPTSERVPFGAKLSEQTHHWPLSTFLVASTWRTLAVVGRVPQEVAQPRSRASSPGETPAGDDHQIVFFVFVFVF